MAWAGVAGAVGVVVAPVALTAAGFTSAGVAAGSLAAATQSAIYGGYVASGSVFALAQSAGAAGIYTELHELTISMGKQLSDFYGRLQPKTIVFLNVFYLHNPIIHLFYPPQKFA